MPVRAAFIDSSGTLIEADGSLVPGSVESVARLKELGLFVATGSNRVAIDVAQLRNAGLAVDMALSRQEHGAKGGGRWVREIAETIGCSPHEVVVVGDDRFDLGESMHSGSILFDATWGKGCGYGIPLESIDALPFYIETFFLKSEPWYWSLDDTDARGRPVRAYAVIDPDTAGIPGLKSSALSWLKDGFDRQLGTRGLTVSSFVMTHLLASVYLSGIVENIDVWTTCPGHLKGSKNVILSGDLVRQAKMFRGDRYHPLLTRHKDAPDSGTTRAAGKSNLVTFDNQRETILVDGNPRLIEGKHILIIDDVITQGFTSECCRNMLLNCGAASVTTVAFEKYGARMVSYADNPRHPWSARLPDGARPTTFYAKSLAGVQHESAKHEFARSYESACRN